MFQFNQHSEQPQPQPQSLVNGRFEVATRILYNPDGSVHSKVVRITVDPGEDRLPFWFEIPSESAHKMAEVVSQMAYQVDSDAILIEAFHKLGVPFNVTNSATALAKLKRSAGTG